MSRQLTNQLIADLNSRLPLQPATGYTSITIEPDNQLPDGIYPVSAWKGG